jgi:hypothetical protein
VGGVRTCDVVFDVEVDDCESPTTTPSDPFTTYFSDLSNRAQPENDIASERLMVAKAIFRIFIWIRAKLLLKWQQMLLLRKTNLQN